MKLTLKEVYEILQKEILWCLEHPRFESFRDQQSVGEYLTKEEYMGFMNGLRQAQYLIRAAEEKVTHQPQESDEEKYNKFLRWINKTEDGQK